MSSDPTDHAGRDRPFWGERTRPQSLEALAQRGPQEGQSGPRTFVSEVDKARKIEIDDGCEPTTVRASRHGGDFYRDGINPEVGFTGYRPPGADLVYKPHFVLRPRRKPMQRINGGEIHPQTFENRHLLHDTRYPWGCIGRVSTDHGTGSGVLVGRNLVVTAAHVIPWGDLNRPIFFDTNHAAEPGLTANVVEVRGYDTVLTGYDWAIMKLDRPLGDELGFMGFNGYSADWEDNPLWTIVGYPVGTGPFFQQSISVDDDDEDDNGGQEFESKDADTMDGDSGGPMFAWWGSDPRVIGVVSGVASEIIGGVNHIIAGGSGFGDLIAWGRSNWQV
jgi:V8-like Glu-specific endopeptidase